MARERGPLVRVQLDDAKGREGLIASRTGAGSSQSRGDLGLHEPLAGLHMVLDNPFEKAILDRLAENLTLDLLIG